MFDIRVVEVNTVDAENEGLFFIAINGVRIKGAIKKDDVGKVIREEIGRILEEDAQNIQQALEKIELAYEQNENLFVDNPDGFDLLNPDEIPETGTTPGTHM